LKPLVDKIINKLNKASFYQKTQIIEEVWSLYKSVLTFLDESDLSSMIMSDIECKVNNNYLSDKQISSRVDVVSNPSEVQQIIRSPDVKSCSEKLQDEILIKKKISSMLFSTPDKMLNTHFVPTTDTPIDKKVAFQNPKNPEKTITNKTEKGILQSIIN